uniref:Uncharacterized protein n=1 Tax=Gopherus agassizii TaxID=38772 RepID=A0A452HW11_9SAUR
RGSPLGKDRGHIWVEAAEAGEEERWCWAGPAGPRYGYEPAKWVATPVKSMDYDSAVSTGFMKLFNYIQGMKIEMTAPVTFHVEPGAGPFCESTITVSFYIPSDINFTLARV